MCVKREESEQGMLEVRKTCGLGECGSGTGEGRGRSGEGETEGGRNPSPQTGSGGVGSCTKESALGMANPLRNFLSQRQPLSHHIKFNENLPSRTHFKTPITHTSLQDVWWGQRSLPR